MIINDLAHVSQNKMKKEKHLSEIIFKDLKNLNDGFDVKTIYYFSEADFEIVLNRIDELGLGIWGIEPWINGHYFDAKSCDEYGMKSTNSNWYRKAFDEFKATGEKLQYAATYDLKYLSVKDKEDEKL